MRPHAELREVHPRRHRSSAIEAAPGRKEAVFLGMNPGLWGMAQTGVPFGTVSLVRDWMGIEDTAQAIVTVPVNRTAANSDTFERSEQRARQQRRVRRMDFAGQQGSIGWRVSTW